MRERGRHQVPTHQTGEAQGSLLRALGERERIENRLPKELNLGLGLAFPKRPLPPPDNILSSLASWFGLPSMLHMDGLMVHSLLACVTWASWAFHQPGGVAESVTTPPFPNWITSS